MEGYFGGGYGKVVFYIFICGVILLPIAMTLSYYSVYGHNMLCDM